MYQNTLQPAQQGQQHNVTALQQLLQQQPVQQQRLQEIQVMHQVFTLTEFFECTIVNATFILISCIFLHFLGDRSTASFFV